MSIEPAFYTDKDIARRFSMSPAWVRGQRHKRKTGQGHILMRTPGIKGATDRPVAPD